MELIQDHIKINTKRRSGNKLKGVKFIVSHDTGNPNSTAQGNVNYYKNTANEMSASAHIFIDDKNIIECVPMDEKAWHVRYVTVKDNELYGVDSNDYSIGIELCYFPTDIQRSQKAYENYVNFHAELVIKHSLITRRDIVGHYTLDPGRKVDPMSAFKLIGKTWDDFISDVDRTVIVKTPIPTTYTPPVTLENEEITPEMKEVVDENNRLFNEKFQKNNGTIHIENSSWFLFFIQAIKKALSVLTIKK